MDTVPKKRRARPATISRAKKLKRLGEFSKKPTETLREQCPTRMRVAFQLYHYDRTAYFPLPGVSISMVIRNAREFARLRKFIEDYVKSGAFQDEKNERKPEPPALEIQLDPSLHRHNALDSDK
jgi:hypothetical protein